MKFREPTKLHRKSGMWGTRGPFWGEKNAPGLQPGLLHSHRPSHRQNEAIPKAKTSSKIDMPPNVSQARKAN
jgi:hypothetical protein